MMTDVACFCGRPFSFSGGTGACPKCGRVASVTTYPERVEAGTRPGIATEAADMVLGRSESAGSVITSLGLLRVT
jgi:hypothetical protein